MTRVCNSPGTRFDPRFGNKILEMHNLFPNLSCPIQRGRQLSILFLYLFIKLSAIFYLLNLAPPRSHPISFLMLLSYTLVLCSCLILLSYAPVLGSVLHLCLRFLSYASSCVYVYLSLSVSHLFPN